MYGSSLETVCLSVRAIQRFKVKGTITLESAKL